MSTTTMRFGPTNGSEAESEMESVDVPVGQHCDYFRCGEPIEPGDAGYILPFIKRIGGPPGFTIVHRDCHLFSLGVIGVDGKPRMKFHEPGSSECDCDRWHHRPEQRAREERRHQAAAELAWESCGSCTLDDCCGEYVPRSAGFRLRPRCTKPRGHEDGEHVACFSTTHQVVSWTIVAR